MVNAADEASRLAAALQAPKVMKAEQEPQMMLQDQSVENVPSVAGAVAETTEVTALRDRVRQLEASNAAMRTIVTVVASGLMSWDPATGIESCRFCSLKRGGEFGYSTKHDETCIVTKARALEI